MTSDKFKKDIEITLEIFSPNENDFTRIHEYIAQFDVLFAIHKISSHALELFFQQRVAEAESRRSEFGKDSGITGGIVSC